MVGLQEMNLAYKYPVIFWNVANLVIDSGAQLDEVEEDEEEVVTVESMEEETDEIEDEDEVEEKKANTTVNYGKVASAIGRMQGRGIKIHPPSINKSGYTFTPDVEKNSIMYGLKGIVRVGDNVIDDIMRSRPFTSIEDFMIKIKVNKPQMANLIKSGAFDEFNDRFSVMNDYIESISEVKKKLNLQNANMLINEGLIPDELDLQRRVFNFNKYIKKSKPKGLIPLDEVAFNFYQANFDMDLLEIQDDNYFIKETAWKKIYDGHMDKIRKYIIANHDTLLTQLNDKITADMRKKYCAGGLAKWSMDAVSFYQDEHELEFIDHEEYDIVEFQNLPNQPEVDKTFLTKDGKVITMYKLYNIVGTVINRDKNKNLITLLTTGGVVSVKAYGLFPAYDKQISEIGQDGKKHVKEKSWFSRGNKIIVQGIKRDENTFFAKKYKNSPFGHHFALIKDINEDGTLVVQEGRIENGG